MDMARRNKSSSETPSRHVNRPEGGKRNKAKVVENRWDKKAETGRNIKDKFMDKNIDILENRPLKPMNQQQAEYIHNLKNKPYNLAVGYAGTSKTYIPTRIAIEQYLLGKIDKIVIVRPAVSDSKSMGFFGGDLLTKARNWILPVLEVLEEFLGRSRVDYMLTVGDIECVPLETIKGRSFKNCLVIVDEAEDMTKKEAIKCITRLGHNAGMVFAGDIRQVDIKGGSGLDFLLELADDDDLYDDWGVVNFDDHSEIVRSAAVKRAIIRLTDMGEM
jgi:phosphate starvation-inducible PhoH-like protein